MDIAYYLAMTVSVVSIFGTIITWFLEYWVKKNSENKTIKKEISNLDSISESLNGLQKFIDTQKIHLIENEKIISRLEKRKEELKPLVETQQQTVEAILKAHTATQKKSRWLGHLMGFFIGVASSAIVTLIFYYVQK